jgi:hypothetical protein
MSCGLTLGAFALFAIVTDATVVLSPQESSRLNMEDLIENVRRNEALYNDIEYVIHESYRKPSALAEGTPLGMREVAKQETKLRFVGLRGMFRFEREGWDEYADSSRTTRDRIRAFDGRTTRLYDQNAIGNIILGRAEESFFRPHMLLLQSSVATVPLSTFMRGHVAMAAYPGSGWDAELLMENTYQGETQFNGLKCHKVALTTKIKTTGTAHDRWELWLAEERNYQPVRYFAYTFRWSKDVPKGEGFVDQFQEIAPGVWFPLAAHRVSYDPYLIQREGKQREQWRREYAVELASLSPKYDVSFFGDVKFPDGTAVYEMQDGKIVRSYFQGAPGTADANGGSGWRWFLWANLAAGVLGVGFFLIRRIAAADR